MWASLIIAYAVASKMLAKKGSSHLWNGAQGLTRT